MIDDDIGPGNEVIPQDVAEIEESTSRDRKRRTDARSEIAAVPAEIRSNRTNRRGVAGGNIRRGETALRIREQIEHHQVRGVMTILIRLRSS